MAPGRPPMRGPKPKLENPGGLFIRLMKFVLKDYALAAVVVLVCIVVSVLASVCSLTALLWRWPVRTESLSCWMKSQR